MAGSGLRPLSNIPHCCLPSESGPCLSPSVADHPLRPATDRSLGRPLPHQLANPTRAHPLAINLSPEGLIRYYPKFPWAIPNQRVGSHALLTRLPLSIAGAFDLHVLGLPPAFVLSQDQTLKLKADSGWLGGYPRNLCVTGTFTQSTLAQVALRAPWAGRLW